MTKRPKETPMLTDRYDPVDLFAMVPGLCLQMEPVLAQLDRLLEDDQLFATVRADLSRRHPHTLTLGRHSTPVEVILRILVTLRLYGWSYAETEYFVADSLVLRQFCRVYLQPVPDDTTLIKWAKLIGAETLDRLNDRAVALACSLKVTRGRKLRVDTTVVETNIHHPSDGALLGDGVRVLSRWLRRAKAVLGEQVAKLGREAFRSRMRTVRKLSQKLYRAAHRQGEARIEALKKAYGRLIETAQRTQSQAERGREESAVLGGADRSVPAAAGPRYSAGVSAGDPGRSGPGEGEASFSLRAAHPDHPAA
jgi:transposase, IS5 family